MEADQRDGPFTAKMEKVRNVLVAGEGFVGAEVAYERDARLVSFRAPGASSFKMRRDEFDTKTDYEIAFYVSRRMRPPVESPRKPSAR
jgi:hypothetical protein